MLHVSRFWTSASSSGTNLVHHVHCRSVRLVGALAWRHVSMLYIRRRIAVLVNRSELSDSPQMVHCQLAFGQYNCDMAEAWDILGLKPLGKCCNLRYLVPKDQLADLSAEFEPRSEAWYSEVRGIWCVRSCMATLDATTVSHSCLR
jgi:hypothetical protein